MSQPVQPLRIMLIEPEDLLAADAEGVEHPEIQFATVSLAAASAHSSKDCDVLVMSIDTPASLDALAALCGRENAPLVIALAGKGWAGRPLEFILTLAEIRGAALGLPKPIDALELALAAAQVVGRAKPHNARPRLIIELERKLAN